jgi:hypothetical protein
LHPLANGYGRNPGLQAGGSNLRTALKGGVSNRSWFYDECLAQDADEVIAAAVGEELPRIGFGVQDLRKPTTILEADEPGDMNTVTVFFGVGADLFQNQARLRGAVVQQATQTIALLAQLVQFLFDLEA